jgi:hypothetical protein
MSQRHPTRLVAPLPVHDPLTCGLGEKFCPGCAADPPDPTVPPWGESLTREYRQILQEWAGLDAQDRPGIPSNERERLAIAKIRTFDRAAGVVARAVNELVTILRWASQDAPGQLSAVLRAVVREIVGPDLDDLARAIVRIEERLSRSGRAA